MTTLRVTGVLSITTFFVVFCMEPDKLLSLMRRMYKNLSDNNVSMGAKHAGMHKKDKHESCMYHASPDFDLFNVTSNSVQLITSLCITVSNHARYL